MSLESDFRRSTVEMPAPEDFSKLEEDFFQALENLPEELRITWEEKYNDLPELNQDFFASFSMFLSARARAQGGVVELQDELSEKIKAEIALVNDVIDSVFANKEDFLIGDGRTAEVFIFPFAPDICIKFLVRETGVDNSVTSEVDIINQLRGFSFSGVRVPKTYFRQVQTAERQYYGMERIPGRDLFQIAQHPDKNKELIALAKSLDQSVVQYSLLGFIEAMYTRFKIIHGDLKHSNIMLTEQGELVVIDFGRAKVEEIGEDIEDRYLADRLALMEQLKSFFVAIDRYELPSQSE